MNKLIFGALAFAAGVYVEKKYNVSDRIMEIIHEGIPCIDEDVEESDQEIEQDPSECPEEELQEDIVPSIH